MLLSFLRRRVPASWLNAYHATLASVAAVWYRHPSRSMIVIGVTGTNGKTTTSYMIAKALEASGFPSGCATTALIKIGHTETLNRSKMTMQGRCALQKLLRRMVDAGCHYAVVETSSQGLLQHRHKGIAYDIAVFTNLTPEHIEAHGSFEAYRKAKRVLFEYMARLPSKTVRGQRVPRVAILNGDDASASYYAAAAEPTAVMRFGRTAGLDVVASHIEPGAEGSHFDIDGVPVHLRVPGTFNVMNATAALAVAQVLSIPLDRAAEALEKIAVVPGRMERVDLGQPWTVLIDYAPEPESMRQLYGAIALMEKKRIIHVLGSCGGGRDSARRPLLGRLAAERSDVVIVTNEDPYDDDPKMIMEQVASGAAERGKIAGDSLFVIEDRADAMRCAMRMAQPGDLVLMTGKGCEPWICVADGKKISWDERAAAEDAIRRAWSPS